MRLAALALLLSTPAAAWDFTASPVCTITHATDEGSLTVTWDPTRAEPYALDIVTEAPLPGGPVFALDFGGFAISTDRHRLSEDARRLTVTDRGFGNVLSGLAAGTGARALIGDATIAFPTDDAAPAVEAFRRCPEAQVS